MAFNEENYIKHHDKIINLIPKDKHVQFPQCIYEAHIRYTVRNEHIFVLKQILNDKNGKR